MEAAAMNIKFEKNKKRLLEKLSALRSKNGDEEGRAPLAAAPSDAAIYGAHSPFIDDLIIDLNKEYAVASFHDVEVVIGYCIDYPVRTVILDMDPPTEWQSSTDVFTTVRTMKPDLKFILLTKNPDTIPIRTLTAKSAIVLEKPFRMDALVSLLKL